MKKSGNFTLISALACIIACIGEFVSIFLLGSYYPGYSQLRDTMSSLGASVSPVSIEISTWWVIMGLLLIFFGAGLKHTYSEKAGSTRIVAWLIILYGLGEGIGSGAFKADHILNEQTTSAIIHDILGGIGVTAILFFPLFMQKVISKTEKPWFHRMSKIVFITGLITIFLFLFRYSPDENNILSAFKGLWQRLFMLNTYIYLITIALLMIVKQKSQQKI